MVTDRQKDVLTCVVDTYIDTAEPMSSKKVLDRMRINVSSATIRQIFLTLDQNGYLEKLHTSSGRIPTDRGYRLFVDNIVTRHSGGIAISDMVDQPSLVTQFHQFFESLLTGVANQFPYVPVLIYQPQVVAGVECIRYVAIHDTVGLFLMYHQVGMVSEHYVTFKTPDIAKNAASILEWVVAQLKQFGTVDERKAKSMFSGDDYLFFDAFRNQVLNDGFLSNDVNFLHCNSNRCIQLPDFQDKSSIESLLDALDHRHTIEALLKQTIRDDHLSVFIGSEIGDDRLSECSLVSIPIALDGKNIAAIGVLGPARMDYQSVVSFLTSKSALAELIQV